MVMEAAARIEGGAAEGALGVGGKIGGNGESGMASAAEDGGFVKFGRGPGLEGMAGESVVAILAGVEKAAALHFDGEDIERGMIVEAASLRVKLEAVDDGS